MLVLNAKEILPKTLHLKILANANLVYLIDFLYLKIKVLTIWSVLNSVRHLSFVFYPLSLVVNFNEMTSMTIDDLVTVYALKKFNISQ